MSLLNESQILLLLLFLQMLIVFLGTKYHFLFGTISIPVSRGSWMCGEYSVPLLQGTSLFVFIIFFTH